MIGYRLLKRRLVELPNGSLVVIRWYRHLATKIIIRKVTTPT